MSLTAGWGGRAGSLMELKALANDSLRCATHLKSTGQGWWGVNCGGAGETPFETLAHGGEEVKGHSSVNVQ